MNGVEMDIITNPPFTKGYEFIYRGLQLLRKGGKMALFFPLRYLSGKKRVALYNYYPPKKIYCFSGRISCAKDGDFSKTLSSAVDFGWFVWEQGFVGETTIGWITI